jgi:uncharacterized membrane protein
MFGIAGRMNHMRTILVWLIIVLAFLGLADSWYLAESAIEGTELTCSVSGLDGCNTVAQSPYSKVFGLPLAVYGVGFYGLIFILGALLLASNKRILYQAVLVLGILGFLASVYFVYLQVAVIKATCIYCIASFVIASLLMGAVGYLYKRFTPPHLAVVA